MSEDYLKDWALVNKALKFLTEEECLALLKREKKGKRRLQFLLRIYGRYNILRMKRERFELMQMARQ